MSLTARIEADDERAVWQVVLTHFPDAKQRFCERRPASWTPRADRYPIAMGE
jgi:hypothetical protein